MTMRRDDEEGDGLKSHGGDAPDEEVAHPNEPCHLKRTRLPSVNLLLRAWTP